MKKVLHNYWKNLHNSHILEISKQSNKPVQGSSPFDCYLVMDLNISIQRGIQGDLEIHITIRYVTFLLLISYFIFIIRLKFLKNRIRNPPLIPPLIFKLVL